MPLARPLLSHRIAAIDLPKPTVTVGTAGAAAVDPDSLSPHDRTIAALLSPMRVSRTSSGAMVIEDGVSRETLVYPRPGKIAAVNRAHLEADVVKGTSSAFVVHCTARTIHDAAG